MLRNRLTDCFPPLPPLPPSSPYNYHQRGGRPNVNIISMSIYCKGFSSQTKRKSVPVIFIRLPHPIFAAAIITPNTFSILRTVFGSYCGSPTLAASNICWMVGRSYGFELLWLRMMRPDLGGKRPTFSKKGSLFKSDDVNL